MARQPLEDIRIIDFCWVLAGPHGTKLLADMGAEVIKVETRYKVDGLRVSRLLRKGVTDPIEDEPPGSFQENNRNKLGLCLDIRTAKGREILERLVRISDVVTANYATRGFRKLGLEWEKLQEFNPSIIVVNMPGMGNWGPYSDFLTFAPVLAALSGMMSLIGYHGQQPFGFNGAYADYTGGMTMAMAVLAALEYRRKTGKGQFIDISQHEATLTNIGSALLDWAANKKMRENHGNHHPAALAAPHNCYPCKGNDRWCVISVASDREWKNFCKVLGNPSWTADSKFTTHLGRVTNQDELDKLVEAWTVNYPPEVVVEKMQQNCVSAAVVQNIEDILKHDSHLRERGFLVDMKLPHPERKPSSITLPGVATRFSGKHTKAPHHAPSSIGENNDYVLKDILGMTQQEIDEAAAGGAFDNK